MKSSNHKYGGQAVIEGVMIRGKHSVCTSVRDPDGDIITRVKPINSNNMARLRRTMFVRGIFTLIETIHMGMDSLSFSARVSAGEDEEPVEAVISEEISEVELTVEGPSDGAEILSQSYKDTKASVPVVERLEVSCILPEGSAPELIENIRQVVMVASRFNRPRGDVLSIMTASFKERRDEKSAEQVLLKNIADKLEVLQSGEGDDALTKSIEKEISGPLLELKEQLNDLERRSAEDKFEYERKTALLRDSLQLRALKEEITSLKNELSYANDARVDSQLTNRIAMLDSVQLGLEQEMNNVESSSALIILVSILGALVVVLLVLVIILLFKKKQGPQQPAMPMPWPYPPPMRKKKRKNRPLAKNVNEEPKEDTDVIRGEIGEMRQSVVSMSVGQPKTATRIVKEWLEDDVVPEPEPEAPPEPEEDDSDKKKKKKK